MIDNVFVPFQKLTPETPSTTVREDPPELSDEEGDDDNVSEIPGTPSTVTSSQGETTPRRTTKGKGQGKKSAKPSQDSQEMLTKVSSNVVHFVCTVLILSHVSW